jgi:MoxR-like ATPase
MLRKIEAIEAQMNGWALEREDVVRGVLVARIARQNTIQVGPPGTAKSMIIEMLAQHVTGGLFFQSGSISPTTDPSALFGPVNVKKIVEEGVSEFATDGMLPEATDAFIDEAMNGSDALLQSLHDIMLGTFKNGRHRKPVPLRSMHSGSNKFATEATAAMFDRFHLRYLVGPLVHKDSRDKMLANILMSGTYRPDAFVSVEDLDLMTQHSRMLTIEPEAFDALSQIRDELTDGDDGHSGIYVSDRRLGSTLATLQANAWMNGHRSVQVGDLDILQHMLWTNPDDIDFVSTAVLKRANPQMLEIGRISSDLSDMVRESRVLMTSGEDQVHRQNKAMEIMKNAKKLQAKASGLRKGATPANVTRVEKMSERLGNLQREIAKEVLGIDPTLMGML